MKIVFDASSLISASQTCLMKILSGLQQEMEAEFIIPESVYQEAVQRPIQIKRFELNAIRIKKAIDDGHFKVEKLEDWKLFDEISEMTNNSFLANQKPIRLMQKGEIEALALIKELGADALSVDERTARMLIETPRELQKIIQARKRTKIKIDKKNTGLLETMFSGLTIVRSVELIALAHDLGILEKELPKGRQGLEAALFAAKYSGCAVSSREINIFLQGQKWKA